MLYYANEKTGYILGYSVEVSDCSPVESDVPYILSSLGLDVLFREILETLVSSRLDRVELYRGDTKITILHKVLILPKRPPIGPRTTEIERLNQGVL